MDPLAEVLRDLRVGSSFYARSEVSPPWGISFSVSDGPSFHVVVAGRCWLHLDAAHIPLRTGDMVVLPHGEDHQLTDPPDGAAIPLAALPSARIGDNAALLHYAGVGEPTLLICGGVRFAGPVAPPLVELLPRVLLLGRKEFAAPDTLDMTLSMLGTEALSVRQGTAAIMTRLADLLLLQVIRAWVERDTDRRPGWLGALHDSEIGAALALIHRRGEERWTVASLGAEVHLSRSAFADRFSRIVGMSPMRYLRQWRMHLARSWIREEHMTASEAAYRLGYSSEAAFGRAFKRYMKVTPGDVQRDA